MCVAMLCYMLSLLPMNISFGHFFAFYSNVFQMFKVSGFVLQVSKDMQCAPAMSYICAPAINMCTSHIYMCSNHIYVCQSYICAAACRNAVPSNTCRSHFPRVDTQSAAMFHFFWRLYILHLKTIHRSKDGCNILLFIFTHVKV